MSETSGVDAETEKRLRESYIKHAALAQLHRWWQYFDGTGESIDHHLDVLDTDVAVQLPDGARLEGLDNYKAALRKRPESQSAHLLQSCAIDIEANGQISLSADVHQVYGGPQPSRIAVEYTAKLVPSDTVLPRFSAIAMKASAPTPEHACPDSYHENRVRSLVHHFTALVEDPSRNPEPFRAVLTDDFSLHYVDPPVASFEALREWVTGRLSSVVASNHQIHDVSFERTTDGYIVTIQMESQAMFPDRSGIRSKNAQTWTLNDSRGGAFAKIRKITIDRDEVTRF